MGMQLGSFGSNFNCPSFSSSLHDVFNPMQGNPSTNTIETARMDNSVSTARQHMNVPVNYPMQAFPMNNNGANIVYIPVVPMPMPMSAMTINANYVTTNTSSTAPSSEASCRCPKSRCLKLYCDCFRSQNVCSSNCGCVGCLNILDGEERVNAIHQALDRNPEAFQEKKTTTKGSGSCACKKSRYV